MRDVALWPNPVGSVAKYSYLGEVARFCQVRSLFLEGEPLTVKIEFKRSNFPKTVILFAEFFYVRYGVTYRDIEEINGRARC